MSDKINSAPWFVKFYLTEQFSMFLLKENIPKCHMRQFMVNLGEKWGWRASKKPTWEISPYGI